MIDDEEVKDADELSPDIDEMLDEAVDDEEEDIEADLTDEFGNPKEEEKVWE